MNLLKAQRILELPQGYTDEVLKNKYRALAMKFHPDKNNNPEENKRFSEIHEAYKFISKGVPEEVQFQKVDNLFSTILKSFTVNFPFQQQPKVHKNKEIFINLTPREYFEGTTKQVNVKERCNCEQNICNSCGGCGFNIPPSTIMNFKALDACMNCVGEGYTQNCSKCENGFVIKTININIAPNITNFEIFHGVVGLIKLSIPEPYFLKDGKMYYRYNISLKDSLTGFHKIFKDPFGYSHDIIVKNIIRTNDGYQLNILPPGVIAGTIVPAKNKLILVFEVIYPDTIPPAVIEQLKTLDF